MRFPTPSKVQNNVQLMDRYPCACGLQRLSTNLENRAGDMQSTMNTANSNHPLNHQIPSKTLLAKPDADNFPIVFAG